LSIRVNKCLIIVLSFFVMLGCASAQQVRAAKSTVKPVKPDIAKKMHISGDVKVEVVVLPNGTVKTAKAVGGHPLLTGPAEEAAKRFKFEPGAAETTETIIFHFPDEG